jgi:dolichol-phosphate mannosyltransferase
MRQLHVGLQGFLVPQQTVSSDRPRVGRIDARGEHLPARGPSISVVVPIYREQPNIAPLVERVEAVRACTPAPLELLLVDDDSRDGTEETVAALARPWVRLIVRREQRGLSTAVLEGLRLARQDVLVVMDGDLSHPPERILALVDRVARGSEFAIGSRYVPGGRTDEDWGPLRRLNSQVATWLARPLVRVRDPMAGFFAMPRRTFERAAPLDPIGYKIGLELLVKGRCERIDEVPIHFAQRKRGRSKLTLRAQWSYLRHLGRLYAFRFPRLRRLGTLALAPGAARLPAPTRGSGRS